MLFNGNIQIHKLGRWYGMHLQEQEATMTEGQHYTFQPHYFNDKIKVSYQTESHSASSVNKLCE